MIASLLLEYPIIYPTIALPPQSFRMSALGTNIYALHPHLRRRDRFGSDRPAHIQKVVPATRPRVHHLHTILRSHVGIHQNDLRNGLDTFSRAGSRRDTLWLVLEDLHSMAVHIDVIINEERV